MLSSESISFQIGGYVMNDVSVIAANAKTAIQEIALQTTNLATGLQNAAPGDKSGVPNNSILYLFAISEALSKIALQCELLYKHRDETENP